MEKQFIDQHQQWTERVEQQQRETEEKPIERRDLLKGIMAVGAAAAVSQAIPARGVGKLTWENFFQKHYKRMTDKDKERVFERIKREIKEEYGRDVTLSDPQHMKGVKFAYCLNLSVCNGNRKCVEACVKENNTSQG